MTIIGAKGGGRGLKGWGSKFLENKGCKEFRMLPEVMVIKYDISVDEGRGGKDKNVSILEALENNPLPMEDKDGM